MSGRDDRILIVDGDQEVSLPLQQTLEKAGLATVLVSTGGEALAWAETNEPSLMLLDLALPDMTGQDLLDFLVERGKVVPFMVVSGMSDVRLTVELMKQGALDFVLKDASFLELVAPVVQRSLEALHVRRQLEESQLRLKCISESIREVFWMMSAHGDQVLYASPSYEGVWGHPVERLYANPMSWYEPIIEEDRAKVLRSFESLRSGREREFDEVYRMYGAPGEVRWIRDRGYANYGKYGQALHLTGVAMDVTEYKALERQSIEAAERERMRIGQDLHDNLCQKLAALKLKCGMAQGILSQEDEGHGGLMQEIVDGLGEATSLTRTIAKGLAPVNMEAEGLMDGLKHLAEMTESCYQTGCEFDCPEAVEVEDSTRASHLFRIAQELVQNAVKHAEPKRIRIGLYHAPGGLRLEVVNDGTPFRGPGRRREGMGLHFVQFRADAIGGTIEYIPGEPPNGGTTVSCTAPLAEKPLIS